MELKELSNYLNNEKIEITEILTEELHSNLRMNEIVIVYPQFDEFCFIGSYYNDFSEDSFLYDIRDIYFDRNLQIISMCENPMKSDLVIENNISLSNKISFDFNKMRIKTKIKHEKFKFISNKKKYTGIIFCLNDLD